MDPFQLYFAKEVYGPSYVQSIIDIQGIIAGILLFTIVGAILYSILHTIWYKIKNRLFKKPKKVYY